MGQVGGADARPLRPYAEVDGDIDVGTGEATVRTTDLSHAYVEENSAYSS